MESKAVFPGGGDKVKNLLSLRKQDMEELEAVLRSWGINMGNGKGILWRGAGTTSPSLLGKQLHSAASKSHKNNKPSSSCEEPGLRAKGKVNF